MMNYIWSGLFLVSFFYAVCRGSLPAFGSAIVESSQSAVTFVIGLTGIMAMWSGLMEVAERTGLIRGLARLLMPFTRLLFPGQKDSETLSCIIMSFMANIFGAGNSSTVFALRAMERLDAQNSLLQTSSDELEEKERKLSLVVANMSEGLVLLDRRGITGETERRQLIDAFRTLLAEMREREKQP